MTQAQQAPPPLLPTESACARMSAVSLMSVLTPAAPGGAPRDASAEAATDSAVFAGLMLEEAAPADETSEDAAPDEAAKDDVAVVASPPAWFAPPPPLQHATTPTTDATQASSADADMAAQPPVMEAQPSAPFDPGAEPAADPALFNAPPAVPDMGPASAAAAAALKAAMPVALAETTPADGGEQPDVPASSQAGTASPPVQDAALLGAAGVRSGAGERLASAREASQAAAASADGAETTAAGRAATAEGSADSRADAAASAARPPAAPTAVETPAAAALAASSSDPEIPVAPPQGAADAGAPQALDGQRDLGLSQLSRATVETTAQIAAQIIKKLDGRSTRFDMALTPEGLGRVDVSLEIEADGQVTARLAFDNPAAAADLRARADELRRQLLDAGLQLSREDLEFAERDPASGFGGGAFERQPDRRAFAGAARLAAEADSVVPPPGAWTSLSLTPDRVDLKV